MRIFFSWKNNRKETSEENWKRRKNYAPKALVGGAKRKERDELEHVCLWGSGLASVDVYMRVARSPIQPTSQPARLDRVVCGKFRHTSARTSATHICASVCMYVASTLSGLSLSLKRLFLSICGNVCFSFSSTGAFTKKDQNESCSFFRLAAVARRRSLSRRRVNAIVGRFTSKQLTSAKEKSGGATAEQHVETNKNNQRIQIKELENQKKNFVREKAAKTGKKTKLRRM